MEPTKRKLVDYMEKDLKNPITVLAVLEKDSNRVAGILKLHDIIQSGI